MSLYGVQPQDPVEKKKKPYDFFQKPKTEKSGPENHYNLLPSAKEPVAADAIVPAGSTYAVVPVGTSTQTDPSQPATQPASSSTSIDYNDPALEYLRKSLETLKATQDAPVKKENRLKAALKMAGYALSQTQGGDKWADVARQAGAAAGGAISGVVQPKLPGAVKKFYDVQKAEGDVTRAEKYANVASSITRRDALTSQGQQKIAQGDKRILNAQEKTEIDKNFKIWQIKSGNEKLSLEQQRFKFAKEMGLRGADDKEKHTAWLEKFDENKAKEQRRQFDAQQHIREKNSDLNERRTAAYEKSVENGGNKTQANAAADAAEAEALNDAADEYDGIIATLDPIEDSSEIAKLKGAAITARTNAKRKAARAGAKGADVRPTTGPNKGVTVDSIKKMSETDFRAYLKTAVPPYSLAETERRVKHWKANLAGK